ncbi:hypothetical protein PoB_003263800 [Plakobranchus ocellatus]|uniref:Uncharacterized protein n=1 Tax=Plakobranchus ocellatus TaxID=259542 RepID=A0AAV4AHW1_9GAST|nr:hypothetical protein PoB_003263800 [Plakobranchus ocellatus]
MPLSLLEAVPLHKSNTETVAGALVNNCSRLGVQEEIDVLATVSANDYRINVKRKENTCTQARWRDTANDEKPTGCGSVQTASLVVVKDDDETSG